MGSWWYLSFSDPTTCVNFSSVVTGSWTVGGTRALEGDYPSGGHGDGNPDVVPDAEAFV